MNFGLSFDSTLSFDEVFQRLNTLGPWSWQERDSAWYGNLASVRTTQLRLDLIESGGDEIGGSVDAGNGQAFAFSVRAIAGASLTEAERTELEALFRTTILPALGASNVQTTDPID